MNTNHALMIAPVLMPGCIVDAQHKHKMNHATQSKWKPGQPTKRFQNEFGKDVWNCKIFVTETNNNTIIAIARAHTEKDVIEIAEHICDAHNKFLEGDK